MKLLLITVKSENALGGMAVWTDRFLAKCQEMRISCSLVNTDLLKKRAATGHRHLWEELKRTRGIFRQLKHLLKTESFDAAYLNTSCGSFGLFRDYRIARLICKKNIPLMTQYHCELPFWIRRKASSACLEKLVACSKKNLVLCENSKKYLQEQYGAAGEKIPNFVEESMVLTGDKPIREKIEKICFVGRISETKGAMELYTVAKQLPNIRFALIGEISKTVQTWETPANVQLLGTMPNEQVIANLDDADLFLFPSHTEGCSMALMEAMARGLPCIATDVGANWDMLSNHCGIVVKTQDVAAMIRGIESLEDPALREEMSRNCIKKVQQGYTSRNVDKIVRAMEEILNHDNEEG